MDLYERLGLSPDATEAEIKAAHRRGVRATHPDAGGDAKAFGEVQKAYAVLSDPGRRAHYDRTGEEMDQDPAQLMAAQARTIVLAKMNAAMQDPRIDPRTFDLILATKEALRMQQDELRANISQGKAGIERLRQFARRLKRKGKAKAVGPGLNELIEGQIRAITMQQAALERDIEVLKMAAELASEWTYETDKAPAPMSMTRMSGFGGGGWT